MDLALVVSKIIAAFMNVQQASDLLHSNKQTFRL